MESWSAVLLASRPPMPLELKTTGIVPDFRGSTGLAQLVTVVHPQAGCTSRMMEPDRLVSYVVEYTSNGLDDFVNPLGPRHHNWSRTRALLTSSDSIE